DLDRVSGLLIEERPSNRRRRGNEPFCAVGVLWHHQLEDKLLTVLFNHMEGGPETGAIAGDPIDIYQRNFGNALPEEADPCLDETLALFCCRVFRVFTEIAELTSA